MSFYVVFAGMILRSNSRKINEGRYAQRGLILSAVSSFSDENYLSQNHKVLDTFAFQKYRKENRGITTDVEDVYFFLVKQKEIKETSPGENHR